MNKKFFNVISIILVLVLMFSVAPIASAMENDGGNVINLESSYIPVEELGNMIWTNVFAQNGRFGGRWISVMTGLTPFTPSGQATVPINTVRSITIGNPSGTQRASAQATARNASVTHVSHWQQPGVAAIATVARSPAGNATFWNLGAP